jgi:nitroreductase
MTPWGPDGQSALELIARRRSIRQYASTAIDDERRARLEELLASPPSLPFGSPVRATLIAAGDDDRAAIKGLSAYGSVKGATGFLLGAVPPGVGDLEDLGFALEHAVLFGLGLGLGTCWIGGVFSRSRFADRIGLRDGESMPVVISAGFPLNGMTPHAKAWPDRRLPAARLFFDARFDAPLAQPPDDPYRQVLQAVHRAPSASNKQPWRVVREHDRWDFYLQRSKGYGKGSILFAALRIADLQRVDMGIAMSHFELAARELGLEGRWTRLAPAPPIDQLPDRTEYVVSWVRS